MSVALIKEPMKGVIQTPDIAKNVHPTPDIKAKNARHQHSKFTPTLNTHLPKDRKVVGLDGANKPQDYRM